MFSFLRKSNPYLLIVGMSGVKMGDRMLQIGCTDGGALAATAAKAGLSGRAVAIVPDVAAAVRVRKGAARLGVHIDVEVSPGTDLRTDEADLDLVVVDDAAGQFAASDEASQTAIVSHAMRVLKPGGRILVISAMPATGLAAMLGRGSRGPAFDAAPALEAGGCRFVRVLGEREGLRFVEGMKART